MGSRWSAEALLSGERLRGPGGLPARRTGIVPLEACAGSDIDDPPADPLALFDQEISVAKRENGTHGPSRSHAYIDIFPFKLL
jgi:hypothetical protein